MSVLVSILLVLLEVIPKGDAFVKPVQKRDSVYVGDRLEYGFELSNMRKGTTLAVPDFRRLSNDTLVVTRDWKTDTLKMRRRKGLMDIRASIEVAPFEEGEYVLPQIFVERVLEGKTDTLVFDSPSFRVSDYPVDSARVARNALRPLIRYPVTFMEVLPWALGTCALGAIVAVLVVYIHRRRRNASDEASNEPAHIRALRELDKYKGQEHWAPNRQKAFYSGVTDTLKAYMEARFGIDAPEMTTAELFGALGKEKEIEPALLKDMKELFETADFIKFAKHQASDDYNARVLPTAVRFVMDTYRKELEEEQKQDVL